MRAISVDLPAFGKPTRPTSASSFSSRRRYFLRPRSPGCTLRGARLVDVAKRALPVPPRPPFATSTRWPSFGEIGEQPHGSSGVAGFLVDERADRHGELEVLAVVAGAVRALAVLAAFGVELGMEAVVDERVGVRAGDDVDRAAVAAVAAARAAARDELLAAEREAAASAVAGCDVDVDFVDEHTVDASDGHQ